MNKATLIDKYGRDNQLPNQLPNLLPNLLRLVGASCPKMDTPGNDLCGVHYQGL